jgi:two-component system, OmpR family, response regulator
MPGGVRLVDGRVPGVVDIRAPSRSCRGLPDRGRHGLVKILLVEDDARIARFVQRGLEAEGYAVEVADGGEDGLELCRSNDYALVILDRMLPGLSGIEICETLRRERRQSLILMLTAKDALQDKVEGLHAGADDYLTKPFAFDELLARLQALLRRTRRDEAEPVLQVGDLELDPATRKARRGRREIVLTLREYTLLAYLMQNAGKVLSGTRILNHVWGYSFDPGSKVVDVYIRYLRQKVDDGEAVPLIRTVRGFGYTVSDR